MRKIVAALFLVVLPSSAGAVSGEVVQFKNGSLTLSGILYRPAGKGPFPAVLYNHGSGPKMFYAEAGERLGSLYTSHGWVFFMPYRRGQGLSEKAGPYILYLVRKEKAKGERKAAALLVKLLKTDHLSDQLAGLAWLKKQTFVNREKIAVAGNSFGGIETLLGAAKEPFCAAIDAAGGAQNWDIMPELRSMMKEAVRASKAPVFFFQAENDYSVSPSKILSAEMKAAGKSQKIMIYPAFGTSKEEGHHFSYLGIKVWEADVFAFLTEHCGLSSD